MLSIPAGYLTLEAATSLAKDRLGASFRSLSMNRNRYVLVYAVGSATVTLNGEDLEELLEQAVNLRPAGAQ